MKVMVSSLTNNTRGPDELRIMSILRDGNPQSPGKSHVCQLLDSFTHDGPNGSHICLVLEPLGLSMLDVYRSFPGSLPLILVQRIAKHLLLGLQYIHECGVIHTGMPEAVPPVTFQLTGVHRHQGRQYYDVWCWVR